MTWMIRTMAVAATVAAAALGAIAAPAPRAQADPGCDAFGWRHPLCAGGAWDQSASSEWGPSASTEAGLEAAQEPSMVPNIDGSISPPGTPGAI
ncbi:hypothetical protein [Mycobacterium neglectum]|jgi:hypothetical protein|uniref:hypothetical protein n=1 Tax=Mycobacterium neglectum TaxID=242737 RepID=UPI0011454324|nr:hypothetical protein [Mycobacterium neglectum]